MRGHYTIAFIVLGVLTLLASAVFTILNILYENEAERRRASDSAARSRENDESQRKIQGLEGQVSQQAFTIGEIKGNLELLYSYKKRIGELGPGLQRDALQLSSEILIKWANYAATAPLPGTLATDGDVHEQQQKSQAERRRWEQEFGVAVWAEFGARANAVLSSFLKAGLIDIEHLINGNSVEAARYLGQEVGSIALEMDCANETSRGASEDPEPPSTLPADTE
jgi:hypothetical protein